MVVNRISGKALDNYFVEKYHPIKEAPSQFVDIVILNVKENNEQALDNFVKRLRALNKVRNLKKF